MMTADFMKGMKAALQEPRTQTKNVAAAAPVTDKVTGFATSSKPCAIGMQAEFTQVEVVSEVGDGNKGNFDNRENKTSD